MYTEIKKQVYAAASELAGSMKQGDLLVVGCSSSEIAGEKIGSHSAPEIGKAVAEGLLQVCADKGSATTCHMMNDYVQFSISGGKTRYMDRDAIVALQSPEAHRLSLILDVFRKAREERHALTESCCTMLMYNLGYPINFIEGGFNNIKIVREEDLTVFSALAKS